MAVLTKGPDFAGTIPIPTSPKKKAIKSKTGLAHATVKTTSYTDPSTHAKKTSSPPLVFDRTGSTLKVSNFDFRFVGIRANGSRVHLAEVTNASWDDSSAVLTGSVTFQTPYWAKRVGLVEGHHIECDVSKDGGRNWSPLWLMQIVQPNRDFVGQAFTANLVNDLQRLADSTDTWKFSKGKDHPADWTVEEVIKTILSGYGLATAQKPATVPRMTTAVRKWHPIDQHPLDVIHTALLKEKNATGIRYSIMQDARGRVVISPQRRSLTMYQLGPALIGATLATQRADRFATAVTVHTNPVYSYSTDKKGHVTRSVSSTLSEAVQTDTGIQVFGYVHKNLYSPDATTRRKLSDEGKLFLAAVAKPANTWTVSMPGMPFLRRLDSIQLVLPQFGYSQICWISDVRHTVDGSSGYITEMTLVYTDPFQDDETLKILNKLSDTATARERTPPKTATTTSKKKDPPSPKSGKAHSNKAPDFGGTTPIKPGDKTRVASS